MPRRMDFVLTEEERDTLERWARRPKSAQALALRCRIVLAAAAGETSTDIAARLGCNPSTVGKWRGRFARMRLDGLQDEPRPGRPRTVTDGDVERVIVKTLEEKPADATHWSTRSMARATGMNQTAVSRIWRAFGLKPHLTDDFKLSPDPQFIDKVRDIVALYLNPPDAAVVLCVDEKSQIQALDRSAPVLPLMPGVPGSTSSSVGSRSSPRNGSSAAPTDLSATSSGPSEPGSQPGTTNPDPSSGTRAPTRSSTASPPTASGSTTQVTRPEASVPNLGPFAAGRGPRGHRAAGAVKRRSKRGARK